MARFSQVIIMYNPASTGASAETAKAFAEQLKYTSAIEAELLATEYRGHAKILAYDLSLKYKNPLIISSSGDGGYHETVNGVAEAMQKGARPLCAVLPAGNANDHYNAVSEGSLLKAVSESRIKYIDLLEITVTTSQNDSARYFAHSYVGLGLTPAIAIELNRHELSAWRELLILARGLFGLRPLKIELDGKRLIVDSYIATNIGWMAKVMKFSASEPDDGVFEVTVFEHQTKIRLIWLLVTSLFAGLRQDARLKKTSLTVLEKLLCKSTGK